MALRLDRGITTAIAAVLIVAASAGITSAAVAADEPSQDAGIGLTVTVTSVPGEIPTPTPSDSTTSPSTGGSSHGGSGTVVKPDATPTSAATPKPGEQSLGGILYVSGLSFDGRSSINPAATEAQLQFTVHNVSNTVISGKAAFTVSNVFGAKLGETRTVQIVKLKPDETRVVQATVRDVGQWGVLHGTVVFTPPKEVEGVKLPAMTRESFFFILPWFVSIFVVLGLAGLAILWIVRRTAGVGAALVPRGSAA